ncbi:MAG TPA: hypothetical protein VFD60_00195 [Nitrososphaeraceae archaeon]|nr:hypothetical protein [Nitrososphaeraceae archaeon]
MTETATEAKTTRNVNDLFDTLGGNFIARLREIYLNTRTTADGTLFSQRLSSFLMRHKNLSPMIRKEKMALNILAER